MRIGIDARPLALESYTGIPRSVYEITKYWLKHHPEHEYFMLSSIPVHFEEDLPENWHILDKPEMIDNQKFWALFELPKLIARLKLDVFWGSNYLLPRKVPGVRYCVTVYDLAIFRIPDIGESYSTFRLRLFGKSSCRRADKVVTISRATAEDVHELFGIPKKKIAISCCGGLPGADEECGKTVEKVSGRGTNASADKGLSEQIRPEFTDLKKSGFFLFISTIEPRKNLVTVVRAFEEYKRREKEKSLAKRQEALPEGEPSRQPEGVGERAPGDMPADRKLVLAGSKGWKYDEILKAVEESSFRDDILMPGYISDAEKAWLFHRASAFLYPSLYEGFGIPVLEAMTYGCPVVTSAVSSLPEVGGDAAFYIRDPKDSTALADRMEEACALTEEELALVRKKEYRQAAKFSWKKNAEQMLAILCGK